jgi:hypothetical protein
LGNRGHCFSADPPELEASWRVQAEAARAPEPWAELPMGLEQFLVLVTCRDGAQQVELLRRLSGDGLACRALMA